MTRTFLRLFSPIVGYAVAGCAAAASTPPPGAPPAPIAAAGDTTGVLAAQRDWWRAFTVADTAYLEAHSAPAFSITLSSGRTYDRAGMLAQAATHVDGAALRIGWAEEAVRLPVPGVAIATSRVTEAAGPRTTVYRYLTVLERGAAGWRVSTAQSTREAEFTPQVSAAAAGPLADYAGEYRTPRGGVLRVVVRDSTLGLIEPSGQELPMVPIGPAVFEFRSLSPTNGIVRFVFPRDGAGRVTSMLRLVPGEVNSFPRTP